MNACSRTRAPSGSRSSRSTTSSSIETTDEEAETRAGLILPASAETQCQSGIVIAVGPEAEGVGPGDKVLFLKDAGYDVRLAGTAAKVVRRRELIARIHD